MLSKIICPYCLRKIRSSDLIRICSADPSHIRSKSLFLSRNNSCRVPGCTGAYAKVKCGFCGKFLPPTIDQYSRYLRLAVLAPSGGGKTVYITVLFKEIENNSFVLGLNPGVMDNKTAEQFNKNVSAIYEKKDLFGIATPPGEIHPYQWWLKAFKRGGKKNTVPTYSLTVFDGAGEDQAQGKDLICRYIANAKMILILLDPLQLYGVRSRMTDDEIAKAGGNPKAPITRESSKFFIESLIRDVKSYVGISVQRKIKTPVAVAFAKMDMMKQFFADDAVIFQPSGHVKAGKFLELESQQVHSEIDDWLRECGDDLSSSFDSSFQTWRYFGLSSFGNQPKSRSSLATPPEPLRVLDPLMWNLHLEKLI